MTTIKIELWHLIVFISLTIIGIFKTQIIEFFYELTIHKKLKPFKGQTVKIFANGNDWEEVTIIDVKLSIPFFRIGGVRMIHNDNNDTGESCRLEILSFVNWGKSRFKYKEETSPSETNQSSMNGA